MIGKVVKILKKNPTAIIRCIGCGSEVSSGFHYTGKMITGLQFATIKDSKELPFTGVIQVYEGYGVNTPTSSYDVGGTINTEKKVAYYRRNKGPVCDECSALCAKTITDRGGNKHQVLILDPRPGYIGKTLSTEGSSPRPSYRTLNTTITR